MRRSASTRPCCARSRSSRRTAASTTPSGTTSRSRRRTTRAPSPGGCTSASRPRRGSTSTRFWQTGTAAGYESDGEPGPRPQYSDDYYGAFLLDPDGNSIEAVHHGSLRNGGNVDHIWIRVSDVEAATQFYEGVGPAAGFRVGSELADRTKFACISGSFSVVAAAEPSENVHLAFTATDNETVDRFHRDATAAGYRDNGAPGERDDLPRGLLRRVRARPGRQQRRGGEPQPVTKREDAAKRRGERERQTGLDPEDEAARWLEEHDPPAPPPESKSKFKSTELHRWRQKQQRGGG